MNFVSLSLFYVYLYFIVVCSTLNSKFLISLHFDFLLLFLVLDIFSILWVFWHIVYFIHYVFDNVYILL